MLQTTSGLHAVLSLSEVEAWQMPRVATNPRPGLRVRTPRQALEIVKAALPEDPQQLSNLMASG